MKAIGATTSSASLLASKRTARTPLSSATTAETDRTHVLFTATVTAEAKTAMARNSATSVRSEASAIDETRPSSADRATAGQHQRRHGRQHRRAGDR